MNSWSRDYILLVLIRNLVLRSTFAQLNEVVCTWCLISYVMLQLVWGGSGCRRVTQVMTHGANFISQSHTLVYLTQACAQQRSNVPSRIRPTPKTTKNKKREGGMGSTPEHPMQLLTCWYCHSTWASECHLALISKPLTHPAIGTASLCPAVSLYSRTICTSMHNSHSSGMAFVTHF